MNTTDPPPRGIRPRRHILADRFLDRHRQRLALALLVSAQFLVMLDTSIVNVALPSIQSDLGFNRPRSRGW